MNQAVHIATTTFDRFLARHIPGYPIDPVYTASCGDRAAWKAEVFDPAVAMRLEERTRIINIVFSFLFRRIDSRTMIERIARADTHPWVVKDASDPSGKRKVKPEVVEAAFEESFGFRRWANFPASEEFRLALNGNGYFLKNAKVFLYWWVAYDQRIHRWMDSRADAQITYWIAPDLKDYIKSEYLDQGYPVLSLETLDIRLAEVMEATAEKLNANVKHQYRWVITSQSLEDKDIIGDLQVRGMQAVLKFYPEIRTKLDAVQIAGKSIKNYGMNLYNYYSTPSRQSLVKIDDSPVRIDISAQPVVVRSADGSESVLTPEQVCNQRLLYIRNQNPMADADQSDETKRAEWLTETEAMARKGIEGNKSGDLFGSLMDSSALEFLPSQRDQTQDLQNRMDADRIVNSCATMPNKLRFLALLTGEYDADFTAYLQEARLIGPSQNNADWQDRAATELQVRHAAQFLSKAGVEGCSPRAATEFLAELREQFGARVH